MTYKRWHIYVTSGNRDLYNISTDREADALKEAEKLIAGLRVKIVKREYDEVETVLVDSPLGVAQADD
jgi:hypothetical protein